MQIDARRDPETQVLSQQILQAIAANPDPVECASALIEIAQSATGAADACFAVFEEPATCVSFAHIDDERFFETLQKFATQLSPGIHANPPEMDGVPLFDENVIVIPISSKSDKRIIGAVCLTDVVMPVGEGGSLDAFFDAFTILATRIDVNAQRVHHEQLTTSILSSITDPLLLLDERKHVTLLNPSAEKLFDMTSAEAAGAPLSDVMQSDELLALSNGKNKDQSEWVSENGRTYVPRAEPIVDIDSNVEGWVIALRDITHFKKLNRNQYEFTRNVTHDLRSPLTSMHGFTSMLDAVGDVNEKQAHFIEKILSGINQITVLVDNIQDAGRYDPETGFYEMSRSQCDLNDLVHRIAENHLVPAEKQELELSVHIADNVPIINADVIMLERALRNLVDNAIKYTPNGGSIKLGVDKQNEQIIISVADSGLGISPENQKHLFERGVRIHREEHKRIKGSGLGLFIVRSVAQRHGGDAWVKSADRQGSTFFMSIPLEGPNLPGNQDET